MTKIAIIGAGNMGGAIARGLMKGSLISAENITISDASDKILIKLGEISSAWKLTNSNKEAIQDANIIIVAVKPWLMEKVAAEINRHIDYDKQIIVSIAAGVNFEKLIKIFDDRATLFRVIPNTAIEYKESVNALAYLNSDENQIQTVKSIFDELGKTFIIAENQMSAYTSLSSCGIAYAMRYIRASMEGGVEMGIYPEVAKEIVMQTLKGAVKLLEESKSHPEVEIDKVTTPGGITIQGLNELEANGFTNAVIKGLKRSWLP